MKDLEREWLELPNPYISRESSGNSLSESLPVISNILKPVGLASVEVNRDFDILKSNGNAVRIAALHEGDPTGYNFLDFILPEYLELFKNRVELLLKSGNPQAIRITIKDSIDKIHSLFLYLTIHEPKGKELRIRIRFIDFEELLRQLFPRIVKDFDIFGSSGSHSLSLVSELDNQGRILKVNKTFEDVLGYKASEVIGLKYNTFIHPSEKPGQILEFKDLTKDENLSIKNYRIRHKSGYWKNFNGTSFISLEKTGKNP